MRRSALLVILLAVTTTIALPSGAAAAPPPADSYIVVLKDGADARKVADQHRSRHGAKVSNVYRHALSGYAARLSGSELGAVRSDSRVAYVERDGEVRASLDQLNPTWGLDRVDDRSGLDNSFTYDQTGLGVTAYVIDTGIRFSHSEFGDRATSGYDAIDGGSADDCDGHGTHVAGTVGGSTYGVAKAVSLVAVRVLDCSGSGSYSGVIAGVDWVTADHTATAPAVANMSLGGGTSDALDAAVRNSIADGVSYAIAAGNGNAGGKEQDACNSSPARVAEAITIGATDKSDAKTSWSNYGSCVDWFAPGYQITSAWHESDTQTNTISGTSMATPHVAGAAALYLELNPAAAPLTVRNALYDATTKGIVTNSRTTNNHLLYTGPADTTTTEPVTEEPVSTGISLKATPFKVKGIKHVTLEWSGAAGDSVHIFRDTTQITAENSGKYTDNIGTKGSGSHTYKVCETDGSPCSSEVVVTF